MYDTYLLTYSSCHQWYFSSKKIILVLVQHQTAVSHRISSVLRDYSYISRYH